jgi:hypothetical protein
MAIVLKSKERPSSVSRTAIRAAVAKAYSQPSGSAKKHVIATITKRTSQKKTIKK